MSRYSMQYPEPEQTITLLQKTIEDLRFNTFTKDYFELLSNMIDEGHSISFQGLSGESDITVIRDKSHLKNYINSIQGMSLLK